MHRVFKIKNKFATSLKERILAQIVTSFSSRYSVGKNYPFFYWIKSYKTKRENRKSTHHAIYKIMLHDRNWSHEEKKRFSSTTNKLKPGWNHKYLTSWQTFTMIDPSISRRLLSIALRSIWDNLLAQLISNFRTRKERSKRGVRLITIFH